MLGLSPWHLAVLVVVGLFVFGPDKLPTMIRDLGKALRQVRAAAQTMQEDLKAELGPEVGDLDLRSLHPRTFVEKHLFGDEEDPLGLDALTKDFNGTNDPKPVVESPVVESPVVEYQAQHEPQEAHPGISFDKPAPVGETGARVGGVKFDADAT